MSTASAAPSAAPAASHTPGGGTSSVPPPCRQGAHGQGRHGAVHRVRPQHVHLQPGVNLGQREHLDGAPPCAALADTPARERTLPGYELATPCAAGHSQRGRPCCGRKISVDGETEYAPALVQVARRPSPLPGLSCREGAGRQAAGRVKTTVGLQAMRPAESVVAKLRRRRLVAMLP